MKTYNIAILGAGTIAGTMAKAIKHVPRLQLYGIASRSLEKAQAFASEYGCAKAYGSYEEMAADPDIDLVYVATPHSHHYQHARLCLEHHKAVLCEKAFTGNARQAKELLALARQNNLLLAEAIWTRYMPLAKKMRELVDAGTIGEVKLLQANLGFPISDTPRMAEPELAGGALLDLGVYPITFASIIFGSEVQEVISTATLTEKGVDAQNSITLVYPNGRLAVLYSSMTMRTPCDAFIYGSEGMIVPDSVNNIEHFAVQSLDLKTREVFERPKGVNGYEYELNACVEALDNGWIECPDMPHAEILRVMELLDTLRAQWGVVYPFD